MVDPIGSSFLSIPDSDQFYHKLLWKLPTAIYAYDKDGVLKLYNEEAAKLWGNKPTIGKDQWCGPIKLFNVDGSVMPADHCAAAIAIKEDREVKQDMIIERPDGSRSILRSHASVIKDSAGAIIGGIDVLTDITHEQEKEEKMANLAAIVHSSDDAIISKRLDGIVISWNDSAERIFGYSPEEMIGQPITKLIPADRLDEETHIISRLKKGERVEHFETQRVRKDKTILDISLTISPIKNAEGKIIGASKIARDITAQKQAEKNLIESEQKFRLLSDSLPQYVWTADPSGAFNYLNQSLVEDLASAGYEFARDGFEKLVHPDDLKFTLTAWNHSIQTGTPFRLEHRFRTRLGQYRWHVSQAVPQKDSTGMITMWIGASSDIHNQKSITEDLEKRVELRTEELKRAIDLLGRSNTELASFTYIASHDLQEPLRKIQTFASLILKHDEANLSLEGKDYLRRSQNAAKRMQTLITDLLSYSKLNTTGKLFEETDLTVLVQEVINDLKERIEEKEGIVDCGPLPKLMVIPFQFRQLFTNLIGNSIKFSKPGDPPKVHVHAVRIKANELPAIIEEALLSDYIKFTISDNGIGFDPQYNDLVFQVFQRLRGRSEYEGTGIGLAICKKIVVNHYGFITANGEENKGTTVTFFIPVEAPLVRSPEV